MISDNSSTTHDRIVGIQKEIQSLNKTVYFIIVLTSSGKTTRYETLKANYKFIKSVGIDSANHYFIITRKIFEHAKIYQCIQQPNTSNQSYVREIPISTS